MSRHPDTVAFIATLLGFQHHFPSSSLFCLSSALFRLVSKLSVACLLNWPQNPLSGQPTEDKEASFENAVVEIEPTATISLLYLSLQENKDTRAAIH